MWHSWDSLDGERKGPTGEGQGESTPQSPHPIITEACAELGFRDH